MGKKKKVFLNFKDFIENDSKFSDLESFGEVNYKQILENIIIGYIKALTPDKKVKISKKKIKVVLDSIELSEVIGDAFLESTFYRKYVYPIILHFALTSEALKKEGLSEYQLLAFMFNFGFALSNIYETIYGKDSEEEKEQKIDKNKEKKNKKDV